MRSGYCCSNSMLTCDIYVLGPLTVEIEKITYQNKIDYMLERTYDIKKA